MDRILKVQNLTVYYDGKPAVKDVSFDINRGEYVCIVGGNGAGKTTIIKALLGLIKHSGLVEWKINRNKVSYVPQHNPADRDFPATVGEIVRSGLMGKKGVFGWYNKADNQAARKAMEAMGIAELAAQKIGLLSGGQQQRVMLARALSAQPEVLVLDEPSSALDGQMSVGFYEMLNKLNKEEGVTPILITHSLDDAVNFADKIIAVNTGLEFVGSAQDYLKSKGLHAACATCDSDHR